MRTRALVLAAVALTGVTVLSGCSSSTPDDATASLEARVVALEDRVSGVEAVVGQALIMSPAAELQAEIDQLEKDLANAEVPADVQADFEAAKAAVAAAQKAAADYVAAEEAEDAELAAAAETAKKAIADAQAKLADLRQKIEDALSSASPTAAPSPSAT